MKTLTLSLVFLATLSGAALRAQDVSQARAISQSQEISGIWKGVFQGGGPDIDRPYRIFLNISRAKGAGWKADLYSAGEHGTSFPVTSITLENSNLKFTIDALHGQYDGALNEDATLITGHWSHAGRWQQSDLRRALVIARISAERLEQKLTAAHGEPDGQLARELAHLEVTERLSAARLLRCEQQVPGPHARSALLELADKSAFLDPPAAEIPALAEPAVEAQQQMIKLVLNYVNQTIHQLPNFFATRATSSFQENLSSDQPFRPMGKFSATVLYRNGEEKLHEAPFRGAAPGLTTSGEFGPILGTAMLDASQGDLVWSHWEQGLLGPEAVFRYAVSEEKSHYMVEGQRAGYQGEIAIDPNTGTILRLVLRGDMESIIHLLSADIVVEYGPVELGGKTYICPLRSVAFSQGLVLGWLNDVVFNQYHLYHATARLLPGFDEFR
jgi:hypothetical protein